MIFNRFSVVIYTDFVAFGSNQGELKGSVHNSATFPMLLLKSSKKVVNLNEISSK